MNLAIESNQGCRSRTGCSSTVIGNEMYIFAGQDPHSGTLFNDVFKVDLKALKLTRVEVKGGSPPPRHSHTSVPLNDKCMVRRLFQNQVSHPKTSFFAEFFSLIITSILFLLLLFPLKARIRRRRTRSSAERHVDLRHRVLVLDIPCCYGSYTTSARDAQRIYDWQARCCLWRA